MGDGWLGRPPSREDVGRHIQDGLALAAEAGFRYYAVYENRTPQAHSLKHI